MKDNGEVEGDGEWLNNDNGSGYNNKKIRIATKKT